VALPTPTSYTCRSGRSYQLRWFVRPCFGWYQQHTPQSLTQSVRLLGTKMGRVSGSLNVVSFPEKSVTETLSPRGQVEVLETPNIPQLYRPIGCWGLWRVSGLDSQSAISCMPTQTDVGDVGTDRTVPRTTFSSCSILKHRQIDSEPN
jgi:hypothetical protein